MNTPKKTEIPATLHRKLINSADKMNSIQQMMQMFQSQCEARLAQCQMEARETWNEIANLGIDVQNIVWEPHPSEHAIVPRQMRLNE